MSEKITIDQLSKTVQKIVDEYSEEANKVVETVMPKVGRRAVKDIKSESPEKSGDYKKNWKMKIEKERLSSRIIVYNKRRYMLTHLLENGHQKRNGERLEGVPHIKPAEKKAVENALRDIKKGLERL